MKVSVKRTNYGDLLFSCGFSLKLVEKSYDLKQDHCLRFWIIINTFVKNYPAKLEIKGLTEGTSYLNFTCSCGCVLRFEKKYLAIENVIFWNFAPFLESFSFFKN